MFLPLLHKAVTGGVGGEDDRLAGDADEVGAIVPFVDGAHSVKAAEDGPQLLHTKRFDSGLELCEVLVTTFFSEEVTVTEACAVVFDFQEFVH